MKKIITFIWVVFCPLIVLAQHLEEDIVQQFGNNLRDWCSTKDIDYRLKAQNLCSDACRVKDKLMEYFATNLDLNINDYVIPTYMNGFEDVMGKGPIGVNMENIKIISENSYAFTEGAQRKKPKECSVVACDIIISGALKYKIKDLYYIKKGQIVKITPYEEVIDSKTGAKKIKVDFSDIIDDFFFDIIDRDFDALGVSLCYSKHFPVNFGVHYNISLFNIGVELGGNWENKPVCVSESEGVKTNIYSKGFYGILTPGIFLRYVTINFGIGYAAMKESGEGYSVEHKKTLTIDESRLFLLMKPSVELNIPLAIDRYRKDEPNVFLCPRVAYNHFSKLQSLNCWEVGFCFRYLIAD